VNRGGGKIWTRGSTENGGSSRGKGVAWGTTLGKNASLGEITLGALVKGYSNSGEKREGRTIVTIIPLKKKSVRIKT